MKLRGIEFGNVLAASGAKGPYWFHRLTRPDFSGVTEVEKTVTALMRPGNMDHPWNVYRKAFPSWVRVQPLSGHMLNAMGLPNPGLKAKLKTGEWQKRKRSFMISLASAAPTSFERLEEFGMMADDLHLEKESFASPFGLQINLSCPNTGDNPAEKIGETNETLEVFSRLNVPLMPKFSVASAPVEAIMKLNDNPNCDAICVSNTIPYDWGGLGKKIFGKEVSPLQKFGGGGISGPVLCDLVCEWIVRLRNLGFTKPINGGGGIFSVDAVDRFHAAKASSIFVGSVATLRPWLLQPIVQHTNSLDWSLS